MPALGKEVAVATRHIRRLRGASQPILAEVNDGHLYVLKFANPLQGPNLAFNESMGTELYRAVKLPVSPWRPVFVSDSFLDENPECWIQTPAGLQRPIAGLCFGSRFLGDPGMRLLEILPGSALNRIRNRKDFWLAWLVDICAGHTDNRQAIFREDLAGRLDAVFIDHGHMFGGPETDLKKTELGTRYLDRRVYEEIPTAQFEALVRRLESLNVNRLWRGVRHAPGEWVTSLALKAFENALCRMSDHLFVRKTAEGLQKLAISKPTVKRDSWRVRPIGDNPIVRSLHFHIF